MSAAIDSVLSSMVASYNEPIETVNGQKLVAYKASKPRAKSSAAPISNGSDPRGMNVDNFSSAAVGPVVNMTAKGTYDAKTFSLAMRNAKTRDERIAAISGYVGYDARQSYGSQELSAMMKAKREITPIKVDVNEPFSRRSAGPVASVAGFVSGMPDNLQAQIQNLVAREKLAVETMIACNKQAEDISLSTDEREVARVKAAIEQERIVSIRKDLAAIGG